jgi:hypothetical protein
MSRPMAALALAAFLAALASLAPGSPASSPCAAAAPNHAAVVVEHGDGSVVTRCVSFDSGQVSGEQLLNASGIAWSGQTFGGFGDAVCAVDGEPARYSSCPGSDRYWAVFVSRAGGAWQLSNVGISTLTLGDGDAEGFRYVPSSGVPATPPSPAGVCVAAASPAATARPATTATVTARVSAPAPPVTGPAPSSTPTATGGAIDSAVPDLIGSSPSPATFVGGVTASAVPPGSTRSPAPSPSPSGPEPGLLAAAVVGGGLAGLAILRLVAGRRAGQ